MPPKKCLLNNFERSNSSASMTGACYLSIYRSIDLSIYLSIYTHNIIIYNIKYIYTPMISP